MMAMLQGGESILENYMAKERKHLNTEMLKLTISIKMMIQLYNEPSRQMPGKQKTRRAVPGHRNRRVW